jgi:hypothetical protein
VALPPPVQRLVHVPDSLVGDVLYVWDFLTVFSKELSLKPMPVDDFVDLLQYRGAASPALTEIFVSLLRRVYHDHSLNHSLAAATPAHLHVMSRSSEEEAKQDLLPSQTLAQYRDWDYTGLKLLPRRVHRPEAMVDALKFQSLLRAAVPRLPSYVELLRANDPQLDALISMENREGERALFPPPPQHCHCHHHNTATATTTSSSSASGTTSYHHSPLLSHYPSSLPSLSPHISSGVDKDGYQEPNRDTLRSLTTNYALELQVLNEALRELESREVHRLGLSHKLVLLTHLCRACYDTRWGASLSTCLPACPLCLFSSLSASLPVCLFSFLPFCLPRCCSASLTLSPCLLEKHVMGVISARFACSLLTY